MRYSSGGDLSERDRAHSGKFIKNALFLQNIIEDGSASPNLFFFPDAHQKKGKGFKGKMIIIRI